MTSYNVRKMRFGNSLVVQWLELGAFMAGPGSFPGQGTEILQAAWYGQKNKRDFRSHKREGLE